MKWSILTLFPRIIEVYSTSSIMRRARDSGLLEIEIINPRDFSKNLHRKVDDTPYGGGSGMVLSCQPLDDAFQSILPLRSPSKVLMTTPTGRPFTHQVAQEFAEYQQIVLLCGHYEGFDERIKSVIPEIDEISLGDFVLTGGELPALSIMDAVTRLIPGAVQKYDSVMLDSFYDGLLDYPHYTRPAEYKGFKVPDTLLSGNHAAIERWRHEKALEKTFRCRPDLLKKIQLTEKDQSYLSQLAHEDPESAI